MKILISNDDGIFAPGIQALASAFTRAGHEVVVCAPDSQRSAASHSLSIHKPITAKKAAFEGGLEAYAIGGTPADCVKLGLTVLCPDAQAVVSGINRGYNVGTDILYSGTVSAAMEGVLCGRMALAVSQKHTREDYTQAAQLAVRAFDAMLRDPLPEKTVLNLNYPDRDEVKGVVRAAMEQLHYDEDYAVTAQEDGVTTYMLAGEIDARRAQSPDYCALEEGYAVVTVLGCDMTDHRATAAIKLPL